MVLFLDLTEGEVDPNIAHVPTFIALSSREIDKSLKSMGKSGIFTVFVVRPHSESEMRMVARLMFHFERKFIESFWAIESRWNCCTF